jgi:hypothetical protein
MSAHRWLPLFYDFVLYTYTLPFDYELLKAETKDQKKTKKWFIVKSYDKKYENKRYVT